jgi:hypothetical protein
LAAATPHRIIGATPAHYLVVPSKLSMWLNDVDGDCVTAEEAFSKACGGILIADATVKAWAQRHRVLNGAVLSNVLKWMAKQGFQQDGNTYDDGPATSVDWTDGALLTNAISQGPVKIGVDGDPLDALYDGLFGEGTPSNGWLATGFAPQTAASEDHCVSLCGYGTIAWLLEQFGKPVPTAVDGTLPGYALFTWSAIGVIDEPSLLNITFEAWLRNPTTIKIGNGVPAPDPVMIYPAAA